MQELTQLWAAKETERLRKHNSEVETCSWEEGMEEPVSGERVQAAWWFPSDFEPLLPSVPVSWFLNGPAVHGS